MMKRTLLLCLLVLPFVNSNAQSSHDVMVSGSLDLIKTDFSGFVEKAQLSVEGNYFITRKFSAGAGVEFWTGDVTSFTLGGRYYLLDNFFVRFRGLIGANDAALGAGWTKPLNETWQFEAMGDFYFGQTEFAIRAGVSYILKHKDAK